MFVVDGTNTWYLFRRDQIKTLKQFLPGQNLSEKNGVIKIYTKLTSTPNENFIVLDATANPPPPPPPPGEGVILVKVGTQNTDNFIQTLSRGLPPAVHLLNTRPRNGGPTSELTEADVYKITGEQTAFVVKYIEDREDSEDSKDSKDSKGGKKRSSSTIRKSTSSRRGRRSSKKRGTQRKQKRRQRRGSRRAY